jgi:hypothetical protein
MAGGGEVRVEGDDAVARQLRGLADDLDDPAGLDQVADVAGEAVAREIPRKSGRLAGSRRTVRIRSKAIVVVGGGTVAYAGPINYGWRRRNIEPAGFLEAGDRAIQAEGAGLVEAGIERDIRKRKLR